MHRCGLRKRLLAFDRLQFFMKWMISSIGKLDDTADAFKCKFLDVGSHFPPGAFKCADPLPSLRQQEERAIEHLLEFGVHRILLRQAMHGFEVLAEVFDHL